ncbi:MAG: hypothetical protein K2O24_04670 [Muribaculaceae bacterium]|nr:hypothetical protein [Muribaculaceae bacterium]
MRIIPDDIYYTEIDPYFNDWYAGAVMDNKIFYRFFFPDVAQPPLFGYRWNGYWYDNEAKPTTLDNLVRSVRDRKAVCFAKIAAGSSGGHGVEVIDGDSISDSDIKEKILSMTGDLILQEGITQSHVTASVNESSVNTIRVMTFLRKDGSVKACSAVLRMGLAGSRVDNASSGGITVGIDMSTGRLKAKAYSQTGKSYDSHPTSGVRFSDIVLPGFDRVLGLVKKQALNMPRFRLISWDIALDETDEPILIEANLNAGELDFHQLNNGPIFGNETDAILKEISDNPKTIRYQFYE